MVSNLKPYFSISIVLIGFFFIPHSLKGQLNIKIGYNLAFPQLPNNDILLDQYLPAESELIQPFKSTGFMHGIQLGLRYRLGSTAVEIGWENISRDRTALSYDASNDTFSDRQYKYSFNGLSVGLDNYIGRFGIGSTLLYQKMSIDRVIGNNDLSLINEHNFGLRLQFIWQVQQSRLVSLMLKPYYQFSLSSYNLQALAKDLGISSTMDLNESPKSFGITLVFYNGKQ